MPILSHSLWSVIPVPHQTWADAGREGVELYGVRLLTVNQLLGARDLVYGVILAFPLVFTLGLLPQVQAHQAEQRFITFCAGEHGHDVRAGAGGHPGVRR